MDWMGWDGWMAGRDIKRIFQFCSHFISIYPNFANCDDAIFGNVKSRKSHQVFIQQIELNTKNSTKRQQSCRLVEFLVQLGLQQTRALINTYHITLIHHYMTFIRLWKVIQLGGKLDHFPVN